MTNIENIKQSQIDINNDLEFLGEILSSDSIDFSDQLKAAAILQDVISACNTAVIPFKAKLRDMGKASGESKYEARCNDGEVCAAVITPKRAYKLSKSFSVAQAIQLPEFDALVEEKTTYKLKRGAAETILSMSGDNRDQWMELIESSNPTPRVSLNFVK